MDTPKLRHMQIPATGYVILRGYTADEDEVRAQAVDFFHKYPKWAVYGLSAFYAEDDEAATAVYQTKLARWEIVQVFAVEDILTSGLEVHPTFRTPHVTVTHHDIDQLLERLNQCPHEALENPYHKS